MASGLWRPLSETSKDRCGIATLGARTPKYYQKRSRHLYIQWSSSGFQGLTSSSHRPLSSAPQLQRIGSEKFGNLFDITQPGVMGLRPLTPVFWKDSPEARELTRGCSYVQPDNKRGA